MMQTEYPATAEGICQMQADAWEHFSKDEKREILITGLESWVAMNGGRSFDYSPRPDWQERMKPNHCFSNACDLVMGGDGLTYCEGYVMFGDVPLLVHHAWVIDEHGTLIDPTLPEDDRDPTYYGIEIPIHIVFRAIESEGTYGVLDKKVGRELIEREHADGKH
jgi:hypothetical protein